MHGQLLDKREELGAEAPWIEAQKTFAVAKRAVAQAPTLETLSEAARSLVPLLRDGFLNDYETRDELYYHCGELGMFDRFTESTVAQIIFDALQPAGAFETTPKASEAVDDGAPPHPGATETRGRLTSGVRPLALTYFDDCGAYAVKRWILKFIIARGETSGWIAPPGAGKSALLAEIAVHSAAQIAWRGHMAKEACGVVIFALERGDLFRRRFRVYSQRDELRGLPIAVADAVIDLLNPNCVDLIAATVRAAEEQFGRDVGLVVIDTYAKGIAANGGDEDKARDQNRAAANLRSVHSRLDVHIALVGHTGKDESRGARGSNAHVGDVDVMVQISGDTIKEAQVIKGNDTPERVIARFKLEAFELGRDEDGDPITTSIVSTETIDDEGTARPGKKVSLPPVPKAALHALHECIADGAAPAPADEHVPSGAKGVTLDVWRERLLKLAVINAKGNYREQFKRIHVTLKDRGLIGIWEGFVWTVT